MRAKRWDDRLVTGLLALLAWGAMIGGIAIAHHHGISNPTANSTVEDWWGK